MVLEDNYWETLYREASACVSVDEELSERFPKGVGVRQGYAMSS